MALISRCAGVERGRRRKEAADTSVIELDEFAVFVLLDEDVKGGEVNVDTVGADRLESGVHRLDRKVQDFAATGEVSRPGAGRDQLRSAVDELDEFVDGREQLISARTGSRDFTGGGESPELCGPAGEHRTRVGEHNGVDVYFSTFDVLIQQDKTANSSSSMTLVLAAAFRRRPRCNACAAADECHARSTASPLRPASWGRARTPPGGNVDAQQKKSKKKKKKNKKRRRRPSAAARGGEDERSQANNLLIGRVRYRGSGRIRVDSSCGSSGSGDHEVRMEPDSTPAGAARTWVGTRMGGVDGSVR